MEDTETTAYCLRQELREWLLDAQRPVTQRRYRHCSLSTYYRSATARLRLYPVLALIRLLLLIVILIVIVISSLDGIDQIERID